MSELTSTKSRRHYFVVCICAYIIWLISFEAIGYIALNLNSFDITLDIDRTTPLIPEFVWPYLLAYLAPFLPLLFCKNQHNLNKLILASAIASGIAFCCYLLFPLHVERPSELPNGLSARILAYQYQVDFQPSANKLPSLHVTFPWLVFIFFVVEQGSKKILISLALFASIISASILFVKQHILYDMLAGMSLAPIAWALSKHLYPIMSEEKTQAIPALNEMLRRMLIVSIYILIFIIAFPAILIFQAKYLDTHFPLLFSIPTFFTPIFLITFILGLCLLLYCFYLLLQQGKGLPVSHLPPKVLVAEGLYKYFRHPIYVSFTLAFFGFAGLSSNIWLLIYSLPFLIVSWILYVKFYEEPVLVKRFGKAYIDYQKRVNLLIPKRYLTTQP